MNRVRVIVMAVAALALAGCSASVSIGGDDDPQGKVEELVEDIVVKDLKDQGISITVTKTDCTDIPESDGEATIDCRLTIEESSETVPVTADITLDGNNATGTAKSTAGLLTVQAGIDYAQDLVNKVAEGVTVTSCDLTDEITVVEPGDTFDCDTDSNETVTITIQPDGTGSITNVA